MTKISFNISKEQRKDFVKTIGEILGWKPVYQKTPLFGYSIGSYTVDRNNTLICPDCATSDITATLLHGLEKSGYKPAEKPRNELCIKYPSTMLSDGDIALLQNLILSKASLIRKSLGTTDLSFKRNYGELCFPWFTLSGIDNEELAYAQFVECLIKKAKCSQRICSIEKPVSNEKHAMRIFLIRLGMIGDEYKCARKILTRNLS